MERAVRTKAADDLVVITDNVTLMRRERSRLEVRHIAIQRALSSVERQLDDTISVEEEQQLGDLADNLASISQDLELYRSHLEVELDKVKRGVATLEAMRGKPGRKALAEYILEDTTLSVKNLGQVRGYYDQVVETIRQLNDEPLGFGL